MIYDKKKCVDLKNMAHYVSAMHIYCLCAHVFHFLILNAFLQSQEGYIMICAKKKSLDLHKKRGALSQSHAYLLPFCTHTPSLNLSCPFTVRGRIQYIYIFAYMMHMIISHVHYQ